MEMRPATEADGAALRALAGRDSAVVPSGRQLLAFEGGALVAALSLEDGSAIADPFAPTAGIVAALRAYAEARTASMTPSSFANSSPSKRVCTVVPVR